MANTNLFINVSNHDFQLWSTEQQQAALNFEGETYEEVDIHFPNVPPNATRDEVVQLAWDIVAQIEELANVYGGSLVVMVQGEMTLTYQIVRLLQDDNNTKVVAACSERVSYGTVMADGSIKKMTNFKFVGFRQY